MQVLFLIIVVIFIMIVNKLPMLLAERRMKVIDVARQIDISKTTLYKIYNEQSSRIDFDTLDKLCKLFNVQVIDILEYVPDDEAE